jgi:hypothetical protein
MSPHRVFSKGNARVVLQEDIAFGPSTFSQLNHGNATFVDKTLVIEAFLHDPGSYHVIIHPRHCGKSHTLSIIQLSLFLIKYFYTMC